MLATHNLDLSKVYSCPIFQSRNAVKSHKQLSRTISDHGLSWGKGNVNTKLFRRDLNQISLMSLGYGAEVEIEAMGFDGFSLVQMPLHGAAEFISDGVSLTAVPGEIAILTPKQSVRTLWQAGCEQLILKVPHTLMDELVIEINSAYKINAQIVSQWKVLLQYLLKLPRLYESNSLNPEWVLHFEKNVALFLLSHQPQNKDDNELVKSITENINVSRLEQLEDYVQSYLDSTISLMDLANSAGVSVRALNLLCHRHFGVSPMVWLRNTRLDAARKKLLSGCRANVTDVALACGFEHLGRFSAYYYARFCEQPRKTRSSCRP